MTIRLLVLLLASFLVCSRCLAADDPRKPKPCEGGHDLMQHQSPPYDFATASWERAERNAFIYRTCVENHNRQQSLYVDWIIPGPYKSYVAPGDSNLSPRPFVTHQSSDNYSCLIYGNSRHSLMEHYIGHADDHSRQGGCAGAQANAIDPSNASSPPWVMLDGRTSVPSNEQDVDGTLIRFVYQVGLEPSSDGYDLIFAYNSAPATEQSHGRIQDITVRSNSQVVRSAMMESGIKDGVIRLSEPSAKFVTRMRLSGKPRLAEQHYILFDVEKRPVGEIAAPYLSSE
jgi:hypothetical protein